MPCRKPIHGASAFNRQIKESFMRNKFQIFRSRNRHIYSLIFSAVCMTAAVCASCLYGWIAGPDTANITLMFIFALIVISFHTVKYVYGILCSFFSFLLLSQTLDTSAASLCVTFAGMTAITLFISTLTSNLTTQTNLTAEREKQLAEAELEKTRANLLRAISHDLRTPLSGILGNSLIFLENQPLLSEPEKTQIVTNIRESSEWLINMVENLLTITRISQDGPIINTNDEIVEEVIGEALQKMEKRHPGCVIHARIPEDFIILPMDVVLIEQVILNLLENAILHSGSADPVDIIAEENENTVTFTVRDYGKGIPETMLDHLFDGTYYSAVHASDAQKGMGIGLVICKTIISAHQGTITGRNHQHGAEFIFTLPKQKEENVP